MGTPTPAAEAGLMGLMINCVAPGIIDTPMRAQAMLQAGVDPKDIDLSFKTIPVDGGVTARSH